MVVVGAAVVVVGRRVVVVKGTRVVVVVGRTADVVEGRIVVVVISRGLPMLVVAASEVDGAELAGGVVDCGDTVLVVTITRLVGPPAEACPVVVVEGGRVGVVSTMSLFASTTACTGSSEIRIGGATRSRERSAFAGRGEASCRGAFAVAAFWTSAADSAPASVSTREAGPAAYAELGGLEFTTIRQIASTTENVSAAIVGRISKGRAPFTIRPSLNPLYVYS